MHVYKAQRGGRQKKKQRKKQTMKEKERKVSALLRVCNFSAAQEVRLSKEKGNISLQSVC